MKADLYVQGNYWATIDLPGHSLLAVLSKGILTHAQGQVHRLKEDLETLQGITCTISLSIKPPTTYSPSKGD